MAVVNKLSGDAARVVTSYQQMNGKAAVDMPALSFVRIDGATGRFQPASADNAANCKAIYGVILGAVKAGQNVTAYRRAIIEGWDIAALPYNTLLCLGNGGDLDTAAGTVLVVVGMIQPVNAEMLGAPMDKLVLIEIK